MKYEKSRTIRIVLLDEAKEAYEKLKSGVSDELAKGISSSENQTLLRSIDQKIELLRLNPVAGIAIKKKSIPPKYSNLNNLWKLDLSSYWRMLYTLETNEIEIAAFILDVMPHPKYDKVFGYRKK
ncbi:hypothetical protein HY989_04755 [Candidatus Micrarchaeota archaeon]|nr:hypothetical protein [Candidatus Micrarchaeota archaeon]